MDIQSNTVASADELAEIDAMLSGLDMPAEAMDEAAAMAAGEDIIEPALDAAEEAEIAQTVAALEASEEPVEIELTATEISVSETAALPALPAPEPEVQIDLGNLEEAIAETVQTLERQEAMAEAYAEQEAKIVPGDVALEAPAEPAAGEKPAKKAKAPKAPKTPAAPRATLASLPDEAFVLTSDVPADLAANKEAVIRRRPEQVKVAEKFDNTLLALAAGKLPSTYTVDCYRVLKASGRTTSNALAAALTATSKKQDVSATYTIGTARSQAGQFMALAPALMIAKRDGKELVLNEESIIAAALDALLSA